jgi:asparagine synthase (glutamine-hydrolysing)
MRGTRNTPRDYANGEALLAALMPYAQADVSGVWQDDRALIVQATHHNTPESLHEKAPEVCAETGRVIASWVRLDNRDELCVALKLENRPTLTDPQIILAAHRQWGTHCAKRLEGDFSFIIYDPARHETYCARDSIGVKPFFYYLTETLFMAATSVAPIRAVKAITLTPDLQWTAMFAALLNFADKQSAYSEIKKLPPAHDLSVSVERALEPREYFKFDLKAPHATIREQKWVDQYREAFDNAVAVRARSAFLVGAESSAGLDSSSIASTLVGCLPHSKDDFHCFGMATFEDEPGLLLATAAMHEIRQTHILLKPDMLQIDDAFHRALKAIGHPPEHWQMLYLTPFFVQSQSLGIRTMMSGYGGDEVVTSYAAQLPIELWGRKAYVAVLDELPGSLPMRLARFGKFALKGAPDPDASLKGAIGPRFEQMCFKAEFLNDFNFLEKVEQWFAPAYPEMTLNAFDAYAIGYRHGRTARLESEAIFSATYGLEYRYPMYDRALLQQFFATPSIEKRRRDMGRYLHRRALQGRVPDRILWQKSKSMGNHLGGQLSVRPHEPVSFCDLPKLLQSILDEKLFNRLQDIHLKATGATDYGAVRRTAFIFQLRQLTAWLNS